MKNIKSVLALVLAVCLMMSLAVTAFAEEVTVLSAPAETTAATTEATEAATEEATEAVTEGTEAATEPKTEETVDEHAGHDHSTETTGAAETTQAADPVELAKSCIDKPLSELIALIGEPESSDYAPSCLNPGQGEDGMLYYDGFVVYTYKEGDTETVQDVE